MKSFFFTNKGEFKQTHTFTVFFQDKHKAVSLKILSIVAKYRYSSFIIDLRHKFTVRNLNEMHVFVQSSELSNIT